MIKKIINFLICLNTLFIPYWCSNGTWSVPQTLSSGTVLTPTVGLGIPVAVASDPYGNGLVAWVSATKVLYYGLFTVATQTWSVSTLGDSGGIPQGVQAVAYDSSGNATLVWTSLDSNSNYNLKAARKPVGSSFAAPIETEIGPSSNTYAAAQAKDTLGNIGIIIAAELSSTNTYVQTFTLESDDTTWTVQTIDTDLSQTAANTWPAIAFQQGIGMAVWTEENAPAIHAISYVAGGNHAWNAIDDVDLTFTTHPGPVINSLPGHISLAVNSNLTAILAFGAFTTSGTTYTPVVSIYNNGSWLPPAPFNPSETPSGIAEPITFGTWMDESNNGYSLSGSTDGSNPIVLRANYIGGTLTTGWDDFFIIPQNSWIYYFPMAGDSQGNVLVVENNALENFGWIQIPYTTPGFNNPGTPVNVFTVAFNGDYPQLAMTDADVALFAWLTQSNTINVSYNGELFAPQAPASASGSVLLDRFLYVTDRVHKLVWTASPTASVASYNIYRDGVWLANVAATSSLQYLDHDRSSTVSNTYLIKSVNIFGEEGTASSPIVLQ